MATVNLRVLYSVRGRSQSRDAIGERSPTFVEKFKTWGETPREGNGQLQNDATFLRSESTYRLRVRYRSGFVVGDQLVNGSQILYITGIFAVDVDKHLIQLTVSETPVAPL